MVDHTVVASSLVEEFTFLCGSEWKRTIYSALYMFGMLFGSYFFGWLVVSQIIRKNIPFLQGL